MTAMVWDEAKRAKNLLPEPEGHGLDFADARDRFEWETSIIVPTHPSRTGSPRLKAIGFLDDALVALVFAPLGTEAISAISLRPASRKERVIYDEA
jgi:uncharacterized protein